MNYGYIEDTITDEQYLAGALPSEILRPDRDWMAFMPQGEIQNVNGVETNNCTAFGTLNAEEGYMKARYSFDVNFSDRYMGIRAGTKGAGNSPHTVVEVQRTFAGMVPEQILPFSNDIKTQEQYFSGATFPHKLMGLQWLYEWEIQHEWVLNGTETNWQDQLYDALQFSPIGLAVYAWREDKGIFVRRGADTHWCTLAGAKKNDYWLVYDSYDKFFKKLEWNFGFTRAKRYRIIPREDFSSKFYIRAIAGMMK